MLTKNRHLATAMTGVLVFAIALMGLLTFGLMSGRWQGAPVLTGSMSPAIDAGALIVARSGSVEDLRVDDIIVFHAPTGARPITVHRVVELEPSAEGVLVTTKGDANDEVDPWGPFELRDQRIWRVSRVVPGLGSLILAVRNPAAQFIGLVLLAIAAAWLFTEDRNRRRPRPVGIRPGAPTPRPAVDQREPTPLPAMPVGHVPSRARIDLDDRGRPIGLSISFDAADFLPGAKSQTVVLDPRQPVASAGSQTQARSRMAAPRWRRPASWPLGALVVLGLVVGANAAEATFRDQISDDLGVISTSSLEPPTELDAEVAAVLGACEVTLTWRATVSKSATGYEILRRPLESAPVTDLEGLGTYQATGPYEVVGTVEGRKTKEAVDVLPGESVQVNSGYRYALRSVRDGWSSGLSESVDVTALGACVAVEEPAASTPSEPTPFPIAA